MDFLSLYETVLGTGCVTASEEGILAVHLPDSSGKFLDIIGREGSSLTEQASCMLRSYFEGQPQSFELLPVDLRSNTSFQIRILQLIRKIPHGTAISYSDVAIMAGMPGAARAIGGAMASNPVPIIIPCHRVVAINGNLTGFTAPGGIQVKQKLLELEGLEFKGEVAVKKTAVINKTKLVCKQIN